MTEYKRVLSIDGGGIKGVFPAAFLADIEATLPEPIYKYFDLIVGTSTGGIIAIGLALGMKASDILEFYQKLGPKIFNGNQLILFAKNFRNAKYGHEKLEKALNEIFGNKTLSDAKSRLVITSLNVDNGSVCLLKTPHHPKFERDLNLTAVEVALATSAAPTYFPIKIMSLGYSLVDGGVWANNPISVAVAEAIGVLDWSKENTKILSVGCTDEPFDIGSLRKRAGLLSWAYTIKKRHSKLINTFMTGQSNGALGIAYSILGHENIYRINETTPQGKFSLDSVNQINQLLALGKNQARQNASNLKPVFFSKLAEEFVPFHK